MLPGHDRSTLPPGTLIEPYPAQSPEPPPAPTPMSSRINFKNDLR